MRTLARDDAGEFPKDARTRCGLHQHPHAAPYVHRSHQAHDSLSAFTLRWKPLDFDISLIRGDEKALPVERVEHFRNVASEIVTLRSMGAFELAEGKITHWRDYFDPRESAQLAG